MKELKEIGRLKDDLFETLGDIFNPIQPRQETENLEQPKENGALHNKV